MWRKVFYEAAALGLSNYKLGHFKATKFCWANINWKPEV